MNFSIVFPSRERVTLLTNLLDSIATTSKDISNVEVFVGIDSDDIVTNNAYKGLEEKYPFTKFCIRERSIYINKDYINWCASMGTGRFIIICNDDALFKTPNWDAIALEKLNNYLADKPDGIVYAFISDELINRNQMQYCCFPLISRKTYEVLGYAMPPRHFAWNADIELWRIIKDVNRILDLSEITIEHVAYHSGKRERDHISYNIESITHRCPFGAGNNIEPEIARLATYINNYGK